MRTLLQHGLVLIALGALAACGEPKPQKPITEPRPQKPVTGTSPQQSTFGAGAAQQSTFGSGGPQEPAMGTPGAQKPVTEPSPQKPALGGEPSGQAPAQAKQEKPLSDGEIMGVLVGASSGEIDMANLAKKNASSREVKDYAATMLSQHTDAQNKAKTVQGKAKIEAEDSETSRHVKEEASTAISNLRDKKGAEFDRLYIDTMVRSHQDVLDTIDKKLMPDAQSSDVKAYVSGMRQHVVMHLSKAKEIQRKIDPASAAAHERSKQGTDEQKAKTPAKPDTTKDKTRNP
jgi:putative membrane protein